MIGVIEALIEDSRVEDIRFNRERHAHEIESVGRIANLVLWYHPSGLSFDNNEEAP